MFHALVLVKIKNGGTEHHLEAFFEIAFVDGRFSAQLLYGDGIADMGKQDFPCFDDFLSLVLVGKEFTGRNLIFPDAAHRLQRIQQEYLRLGVDENIFNRIGVAVIEDGRKGMPDSP